MSLPSTITNISHIEQVNDNDNENNNERNLFSNNGSNGNENENDNENEYNNNSTITQESYNEENSNNNNLPFPMNLTKIYRRKSRKMTQTRKTRKAQRGGSKIPGVSNVVRITGTTLKKIGNVGIYGLKKVGNGVHVITHVVNKGVTAITGRNNVHRGKTAKKGKGKKQH
jgi:hypothetical protein